MAAEHIFILERVSESWHILLWAGLALILAWWSWTRYGPSTPGISGTVCKCLRVLSIISIVATLAGPAFLNRNHSTNKGRVLVMVDTSASMALEDRKINSTTTSRIGIANELAQELAQRPHIDATWISHTGKELNPQQPFTGDLATTSSSPIGNALQEQSLLTRPDWTILVSDGRFTRGAQAEETAQALRQHNIHVSCLETGSTHIEPSIHIVDIIGPRDVPLRERQPFLIRLRGRQVRDTPVSIQLSNGPTVLTESEGIFSETEQAIDFAQLEESLSISMDKSGITRLTVSVSCGDYHDSRSFSITVRERRLSVLMLAMHPRYDMRYIREALDRDTTTTLHSYLADGGWHRWGDAGFGDPISNGTLPLTQQQAQKYDAIILGDIGSQTLSPSLQSILVTAVRQHGVGLIWVPGERGAIADFAGTELGKLIPVQLGNSSNIARGYLDGDRISPRQSAYATSMGLLTPGRVPWNLLPALFGSCPIQDIQAGAAVLMEYEKGDEIVPLIVSRNYDSGTAVFIGTDDTFRWRKNAGDIYLHRFHSQIIRWASRGRQLAKKPWRTVINPLQATQGEPLEIALVPSGALDGSVSLPSNATIRLNHNDENREQLVRLLKEGNTYRASISAPHIGTWTSTLADGLADDQVQPTEFTVTPADEEQRDTRLDHEALSTLARGTGSDSFTSAKALVKSLPELHQERTTEQITTLWDHPLLYLLIILLLGSEWAIRRYFRLP